MILANIELPVLIVYIVMAVGFIVMVWGIKNQNTKSIARIVMILGALVVFGAFAASFFVSGAKSEDKRLDKNARTFLIAKAERAATYIAERFPDEGSAAFLIDEASYNDSASDIHFVLDEVQKRLSEKGVSCGEVYIVGESKQVIDKKTGEENTVIEDPTDAAIMKKKLDQAYDKVDIVVNFVGLPSSVADLKKITFLTRKNTATGKNNMLLMCDDGLPYVEQDMLKAGRVCAIIDYVSSAAQDFDMQKDSAPKDLSDAFNLMFFFVNPENLEEFISDNPNYFITK